VFLFKRPSLADIDDQILTASGSPVASPWFLSFEEEHVPGDLGPFVRDESRSCLGYGEAMFAAAKRAFAQRQMFDLGWVRVVNAAAPIACRQVVAVEVHTLGLWTVNLSQILEIVDTETRFGLLYSTTKQHVERGEEIFPLRFDPATGEVRYELEAVSRPRAFLARIGYPVTRHFQYRFARDSHEWMRKAVVRDGSGWSTISVARYSHVPGGILGPLSVRTRNILVVSISALVGACFGLSFRLALDSKIMQSVGVAAFWTVTIAFLVVVPISMGYLTVDTYLRYTAVSRIRWYQWLFLPWVAVLLEAAFAILVKIEGVICILFASPIMLLAALFGGLAARLVWHYQRGSFRSTVTAVAAPLLLLLFESHVPSPWQIRTVETDILIRASPQAVWSNIESVRAIKPEELPGSWVQRIGFPRPIQATLSHEGIGGVRQASFTGGLVFTETVNRWSPLEDLRFSIHANTDAIPTTTLDEHVTIGGAFFDVLDGEYRLEPRADGVLLHLTSHERLSTHLNPYASFWTDAVMRAIQRQILEVIRDRCEAVNLKA
jgi:uncharacterized protein (UPF0548 family)